MSVPSPTHEKRYLYYLVGNKGFLFQKRTEIRGFYWTFPELRVKQYFLAKKYAPSPYRNLLPEQRFFSSCLLFFYKTKVPTGFFYQPVNEIKTEIYCFLNSSPAVHVKIT
jgi:hypothetical protein